jgi:hypothetical protein
MATYTDHHLDVQYKNGQYDMFRPIGFHSTYDEAFEWLKSVGLEFTENFYDYAQQGCAFVIIEQTTLSSTNFSDWLDDDELGLYMLNRSRAHYVFSEESYRMCLNEHLMYYDHDWDNEFPIWIKFVKPDGSITTGCDLEHFKKVQSMKTYFENNTETKQKELKAFKKYLSDGNEQHLFQSPRLAFPLEN